MKRNKSIECDEHLQDLMEDVEVCAYELELAQAEYKQQNYLRNVLGDTTYFYAVIEGRGGETATQTLLLQWKEEENAKR